MFLCIIILQHYASEADKVWLSMNDLNDNTVKNVHDGYLKRFQLDKAAQITFRNKHDKPDVILIDEAQDLTPGN